MDGSSVFDKSKVRKSSSGTADSDISMVMLVIDKGPGLEYLKALILYFSKYRTPAGLPSSAESLY